MRQKRIPSGRRCCLQTPAGDRDGAAACWGHAETTPRVGPAPPRPHSGTVSTPAPQDRPRSPPHLAGLFPPPEHPAPSFGSSPRLQHGLLMRPGDTASTGPRRGTALATERLHGPGGRLGSRRGPQSPREHPRQPGCCTQLTAAGVWTAGAPAARPFQGRGADPAGPRQRPGIARPVPHVACHVYGSHGLLASCFFPVCKNDGKFSVKCKKSKHRREINVHTHRRIPLCSLSQHARVTQCA